MVKTVIDDLSSLVYYTWPEMKKNIGVGGGRNHNNFIKSIGEIVIEIRKVKSIFCLPFQPLLGASQYHWLSNHLGRLGDLHYLCTDGCQDPFRLFPSLLTTKIIGFLEPQTLLKCRQVCQFWKHLFNSEWIWHRLAYLPRWCLSVAENDSQLDRHRQSGFLSWRTVFRERYKLKRYVQ